MQGSRARITWASGGLVLVTAVLSGASMGDWCCFSPDVFHYLTIARSLVETGHLPQQQMMVPPGFPIIIAPLLVFGDVPFLALRVLFSICWAVTGVMTYLLYRRELGECLGWVAGLLVAGSPVLLMLTITPISEPVYIAILSAALVMMDSWRRRPVRVWWHVALGGLLTAAACAVRSIGVVLLPIMGITLLHHRGQTAGRRALWAGIFALCAFGPWAAWQIRQGAYPSGPSYMDIWTTAIDVEKTNATGLALQIERFSKYGPMRLESIKEIVIPRGLGWRAYQPPLDKPTTCLVGGFFVVVALIRFIRNRSGVDAYVLLTLLVLSLWPWDEGVRLVAPLIPVLVGYPLWAGLILWHRKGARRRERFALSLALVLMLAVHAGGMVVAQSGLPARREKAVRRFAAMSALAGWHESNTPDGASWTGVTPNRHNSKLLLLGAAYLSRRPVTTIDVHEGMTVNLPPNGASCVLLHESLFQSDGTIVQRGYAPADSIGEFVVLKAVD